MLIQSLPKGVSPTTKPVRLAAIAIAAATSHAHAQEDGPESLGRAAIQEPSMSVRAYASSGVRGTCFSDGGNYDRNERAGAVADFGGAGANL